MRWNQNYADEAAAKGMRLTKILQKDGFIIQSKDWKTARSSCLHWRWWGSLLHGPWNPNCPKYNWIIVGAGMMARTTCICQRRLHPVRNELDKQTLGSAHEWSVRQRLLLRIIDCYIVNNHPWTQSWWRPVCFNMFNIFVWKIGSTGSFHTDSGITLRHGKHINTVDGKVIDKELAHHEAHDNANEETWPFSAHPGRGKSDPAQPPPPSLAGMQPRKNNRPMLSNKKSERR